MDTMLYFKDINHSKIHGFGKLSIGDVIMESYG